MQTYIFTCNVYLFIWCHVVLIPWGRRGSAPMGDAEGGRRNFQSMSFLHWRHVLRQLLWIQQQTNARYIYCARLPWIQILRIYIYIWIDRHIFIQPVYVYKYAAYIYGELECGRQNVYVLSCCFALRLVDLQDINLCMHVYLYWIVLTQVLHIWI